VKPDKQEELGKSHRLAYLFTLHHYQRKNVLIYALLAQVIFDALFPIKRKNTVKVTGCTISTGT